MKFGVNMFPRKIERIKMSKKALESEYSNIHAVDKQTESISIIQYQIQAWKSKIKTFMTEGKLEQYLISMLNAHLNTGTSFPYSSTHSLPQ